MVKQNRSKLWYRNPATEWEEALPVGNGRIGGMVFGGIQEERIQLNDDTLWSGDDQINYNEQAKQYLPQARQLIAEDRYIEAEQIVEKHMDGDWTESYMPAGDLVLSFNHIEADHYVRELDLHTAQARTVYEHEGIRYTREVLVSAVDDVMVIHLTSNQSRQLQFKARLCSPHRHKVQAYDGNDGGRLALIGNCPVHVKPDYLGEVEQPVVYEDGRGMRFAIGISIQPFGGTISVDSEERLCVEGADSALLFVSTATGYRDTDKEGTEGDQELIRTCEQVMTKAREWTYEQLLNRHIVDYQRLYHRVDLDLGGTDYSHLPTDERVIAYKNGNDDRGFAELVFQYGRYLLISSSRPGTQAANLQGIWNHHLRPPWSSNYTTNINVQMNYWPAEVCNLSECHEPLIDLIAETQENGRKTAQIHYGCRGWTAHHNVDLWRSTVPTKINSYWFFWPLGGAWLCLHLWEHYAFTNNRSFLKNIAYPLMKDAAYFCLDWLIENEDGYLVTSPSTSPENAFLTPEGEKCGVSAGSTMDLSIIRQLFLHCIEAARILNVDREFSGQLEEALSKILPFQIGRYGQLQEWSHDFEETEPGHRHLSHLYGLFPGNLVDVRKEHELAAAFQKSLERRQEHGAGERGWGGAWSVHLWARLGNGNKAYSTLHRALSHKTSLYSNLFNGRWTFQIDGNLGLTSGIAEMLLQSHQGEIELLPALPDVWTEGYVKGLRARGGYEVDITWREGKVTEAVIRSDYGGICRIRIDREPGQLQVDGKPVQTKSVERGVIEFEAKANHSYVLSF